MSAVAENAWENHHPIHWEETMVLAEDRSCYCEEGPAHPDHTL